jgi:serine/threonine-protein kinase RsbW
MTSDDGRDAITLTAPARPGSIAAVHEALDRLWAEQDAPGPGTRDRQAFGTAVVEIASNVIRHSGSDSFDLKLTLTGAEARAVFDDHGQPVTVDLTALGCQADPTAEHGRGLHLAQAASHQLRYTRQDERNRWIVVRRLSR